MKKVFAILLAMIVLCCATALADESELTVSGIGKVYMVADQASASLGLTITGDDLTQLQQQANETVAAICEALQKVGLDEKNISTNYIFISPRYDYSDETEKVVGYNVTNSLTIVTDRIDQIGAYIDAAFAAGANTFDSISFSAKDDSAARKQALELSIVDAREKAEVIAAASGKTLGDVIEIRENNENSYYYSSMSGGVNFMQSEAAAADTGTTVRASQVEVSAGIEITYALK